MYYVVTGAAGFVGSNLVRALNARGERDILAVDNLRKSEKFSNLVGVEIADYMDKHEFHDRLVAGDFDGSIDVMFHQGACSDTMETDGQYMMENNYRYSVDLLDFCIDEEVPLLYASSAAVYGGSTTFREELAFESPLNVYGYSKYLFDQVVRRRMPEATSQIAGFRYFNVYGPHEDHKGRMASVAWHFFNQFRRADGCVQPFAGSGGYADGEQMRDFVSVEDVVKVNLFMLDHPDVSGIFNVGTGRAQTFNDVARAVVNACRAADGKSALQLEEMKSDGLVRYRAFPAALEGKYQHFTQADVESLRKAGYSEPFLTVEQGVGRYVGHLVEASR